MRKDAESGSDPNSAEPAHARFQSIHSRADIRAVLACSSTCLNPCSNWVSGCWAWAGLAVCHAPTWWCFGFFTFLPILINLVYAATGGVQLFPFQRPFTGWENFGILLECRDYFDIQTCRKDVFWRAIFNTVKFSLIQVVLMVLLSLLTALVLNRKIIGRGFWRGVFFYPVLLSPVVVALIWKWLLQSQGVFNAAWWPWGARRWTGSPTRVGHFSGPCLSRSGPTWGFTR
jgi:ABC-type sugar transport system permease subunit